MAEGVRRLELGDACQHHLKTNVYIVHYVEASTNQIAVSSNQHKQYLNITCSKYTFLFFIFL